VLTDRSFRGHVARGDHFIMMYAPWCGHCKNLKPSWEQVGIANLIQYFRILLGQLINLKGQCHKMVVEVRPWSGRLGLN
jgi:thiol-disulfide isomerase/thioredoxin